MLRYTLRRILLTVPVLLGVATLVFALIHLVPGDPAEAMLGESAPATDLAELRARLGLDRPLLVQYREFLTGLVRGDLGVSFRYNAPVSREIGRRLSRTAELALAAMAVAVAIAIPLGIVGALFRGGPIDQAAMPMPSWGTMLDAGRSHLFDAPHLTIVPGCAIALLVLGFNFAGDALRDRLDPRAL